MIDAGITVAGPLLAKVQQHFASSVQAIVTHPSPDCSCQLGKEFPVLGEQWNNHSSMYTVHSFSNHLLSSSRVPGHGIQVSAVGEYVEVFIAFLCFHFLS